MTTQTFPALFAAAVAARPGATAVRAAGTTLSYAELDRASSRLAHQLIERGAGPEKVIAVELPRSRGGWWLCSRSSSPARAICRWTPHTTRSGSRHSIRVPAPP